MPSSSGGGAFSLLALWNKALHLNLGHSHKPQALATGRARDHPDFRSYSRHWRCGSHSAVIQRPKLLPGCNISPAPVRLRQSWRGWAATGDDRKTKCYYGARHSNRRLTRGTTARRPPPSAAAAGRWSGPVAGRLRLRGHRDREGETLV